MIVPSFEGGIDHTGDRSVVGFRSKVCPCFLSGFGPDESQLTDPVHLKHVCLKGFPFPPPAPVTPKVPKRTGKTWWICTRMSGLEVHRKISRELNQSGEVPTEAVDMDPQASEVTKQETNAHGQAESGHPESEFVDQNKPTATLKSDQETTGKAIPQCTGIVDEMPLQPPGTDVSVDGDTESPGPYGHTRASDSSAPSPSGPPSPGIKTYSIHAVQKNTP